MSQSPQLEFWFDFGSNYSYLAAMRIESLAAAHGVSIAYQPVLLGPVFKALGWDTSPFVLQKEKGRYVGRDMERLCSKYGLPWRQPGIFPRRALLPLRVALLGAQQPWIGAFCQRIMLLNFAEDRDIDSPDAVIAVLSALGLPAAQLIEQAQSEPNKQALRRQGEEATRRGLFGAPMFFAGDEMFWGNDRLEDAILFAASRNVAERPSLV